MLEKGKPPGRSVYAMRKARSRPEVLVGTRLRKEDGVAQSQRRCEKQVER